MPYNKPKYGKGVPKGYKHDWTYRGHWAETKVGPGRWKVRFKATKRSKSGKGGPKPGFQINWGFKNMKQKAIKIGRGIYQTELTAIKYLKKKPYYKRGKK